MVQVSSATSQLRPLSDPGQGRKTLHHLGADDRSSTRVRIVDAALACMARQGLGKTTVDDIDVYKRQVQKIDEVLARVEAVGRDEVLARAQELVEGPRTLSAVGPFDEEAFDDHVGALAGR